MRGYGVRKATARDRLRPSLRLRCRAVAEPPQRNYAAAVCLAATPAGRPPAPSGFPAALIGFQPDVTSL